MLLGKRPRPPMKRTTSMSEITFDQNTVSTQAAQSQQLDPNNPFNPFAVWVGGGGDGGGGLDGLDQRLMMKMASPSSSSPSPRSNRRNPADFVETAHFLRSCGLCKRRLVPGRDIYMYRGDTAFCSLECRQQQMNLDERNVTSVLPPQDAKSQPKVKPSPPCRVVVNPEHSTMFA